MEDHTTSSVNVPAEIVAHMKAHAAWTDPMEACGLLATSADGVIRFFYACTNVDQSATSFTVDPVEHFRALVHAESNGWEIGGSFHSHPTGPVRPSATDIASALDRRWIYAIGSSSAVRAFRIDRGRAREVALSGPDQR